MRLLLKPVETGVMTSPPGKIGISIVIKILDKDGNAGIPV